MSQTIELSDESAGLLKRQAAACFKPSPQHSLHGPVSYGAVFKLAEANGLTVYDAAYLDLAIRKVERPYCIAGHRRVTMLQNLRRRLAVLLVGNDAGLL